MSIRVRFAPSPTGFLHIGGARTALFNWLHARHTGGCFILRIEDTDQERSTSESEAAIYHALKWLGLDWDEGPQVGGDFGPYRQSERQHLYRENAQQLIDAGVAYRCFCQPEATGEKPVNPAPYPGTCRAVSNVDSDKRAAAGETFAIRFKVKPEPVVLKDELRGNVEFDMAPLGDQILIRRDGFPTYNFACVVDDGLMKITDVIRGDDHLSNTPKQVLYYQALNIPVPRFHHVSMILGNDGERLSKRHGDTSVEEFQSEGFLPETVVNFLALLGWSAGNDQEIYQLAELVKDFDISRVSKSAAVFNVEKMRWMNGQHLRTMAEENYISKALPHLTAVAPQLDESTTTAILREIRNHIATFSDVAEKAKIYLTQDIKVELTDPETITLLKDPLCLEGLELFKADFSQLDNPDDTAIKEIIKKIGKEAGIKGPKIYKPLRLAMTGLEEGPGILGVMTILAPEKVIARLDNFITILKNL